MNDSGGENLRPIALLDGHCRDQDLGDEDGGGADG